MKKKTLFFLTKVLPVLVWLAVIYVLSSFPGSNYPKEPQLFSWTAHAAQFFVLGFLVAQMIGKRGVGAFIFALVFCLLYAASDEWHQKFVVGRESSVVDFAVDGVGGLIGILGFYFRK